MVLDMNKISVVSHYDYTVSVPFCPILFLPLFCNTYAKDYPAYKVVQGLILMTYWKCEIFRFMSLLPQYKKLELFFDWKKYHIKDFFENTQ